jgi:hypothetical protein
MTNGVITYRKPVCESRNGKWKQNWYVGQPLDSHSMSISRANNAFLDSAFSHPLPLPIIAGIKGSSSFANGCFFRRHGQLV